MTIGGRIGMTRGTALSDYAVPTLFAALITAALAQIAFMADLYSGALYRPEIGRVLMLVLFSPIVAIPSLIFGMLVVWPTVLVLAFLAGKGAERAPSRYRLPIWLAMGALTGMPVLYGYSFLLGLGQARLGHLLKTALYAALDAPHSSIAFSGRTLTTSPPDSTTKAPMLKPDHH
jgi:hypothetical protein